jgi:hypothetical protein
LNALRSDLDSLRKDAGDLASDVNGATSARYKDTIRAAEALAERSVGLAEEAAERVSRITGRVANDVEDYAQQGATSLRGAIQDQPLIVLLLTLGIGAFLGAVFSRR